MAETYSLEDFKAELFSKEDTDKLLAAINLDETPEDLKPDTKQKIIKIYDFKRPDKFSNEQIRNIFLMHETFAKLTKNSLSAQLRSTVHIQVESVDQLTYGEFISSIPTPTTLAIINMDPLKGNAAIEIDPSITFAIIDRICGGNGDGIKSQHELTEIEQSVMEGIIIRLLGNLREAWSSILDLRPRLGQIDTNPKYAKIVPDTEMTVTIFLEVKISDVEGMINICVPYLTVEPIIGKFSNYFWYDSTYDAISSESAIYTYREDIPIQLTAEIFRRNFSIKEIWEWDVGTVIMPLISIKSDYCYLKLGNRRIWQCQILQDDKCFPKRITIVNYAEKPYGMEENDMKIEESRSFVADALYSAKMKISVELGRTRKPVKEVFAMGEGTILELDKLAGEPVDILANGVRIAKGETVVIDENFGVRITEIPKPSPEPPAPQMLKKAFAEFDSDSFNEFVEKAINESLKEST